MEHSESCTVDPIAVTPERDELERASKIFLAINGMGCQACVNRVRNAILRVPGVVQVQLHVGETVAQVWFHENEGVVERMVTAVSHAGAGTHHTYLAVPIEPWVSRGRIQG